MNKQDKKVTLKSLIFNAKGNVLLINNELPGVTINLKDGDKVDYRSELYQYIKSLTGMECGIGDVLFDDFNDADNYVAYMTFVSDVNKLDNVNFKWDKIVISDANSVEARMIAYLNNTLFNPYKLIKGNCYESLITGECFFVIEAITDQASNRTLYVVESNMASLPMVLPASAVTGNDMRWIPHLRLSEIQKSEPESPSERAKRFFIKAHNDTLHFYGDKLYSYHLAQVVSYFHKYKHLIPQEDWDHVESELWGHDGVEDARLTWNDIKKELGSVVADGCFSMTNNAGKNRKERSDSGYYAKLAKDPFGEFKKLCDRLANVKNSIDNGHSMKATYAKEFESFKNSLNTNGDKYIEMWDELAKLSTDEKM